MKKVICCVLIFVLAFAFVGCGKETENGNDLYKVCENVSMVAVEKSQDFIIYVHKETRVMYLYENRTQRGGITIMLDENGKPLLWEGEL